MKNVKESLKNVCVRMSTQLLSATAVMFALMMCHGRLYEPRLPEKLRR